MPLLSTGLVVRSPIGVPNQDGPGPLTTLHLSPIIIVVVMLMNNAETTMLPISKLCSSSSLLPLGTIANPHMPDLENIICSTLTPISLLSSLGGVQLIEIKD